MYARVYRALNCEASRAPSIPGVSPGRESLPSTKAPADRLASRLANGLLHIRPAFAREGGLDLSGSTEHLAEPGRQVGDATGAAAEPWPAASIMPLKRRSTPPDADKNARPRSTNSGFSSFEYGLRRSNSAA